VAYQRDPLSLRFDGRALDLVTRAYRVKGEWAGDYVPQPGPRARAWMLAHGIYRPYERDRWGEVRWLRAYKRSVFHLVNWYGGTESLRGQRNTGAGSGGWHAPVRVEWETGVRVERPEWVLARWAVRIRIHPAGRKTSEIGLARAEREGNNWIDPATMRPNFRQSLPDDRPWEAAG
jgi:hypothetical protein